MIGYKVAKNDKTKVIVTLEIPKDARTNMGRSSIAVKETAAYRADKVKVLAIEDASGTSYKTATTNFEGISLTYKVGEVVEEPSFNPDKEEIYAEGIHYYITRHIAELACMGMVENGPYHYWHANGRKCVELTSVNWKLHGLYQHWLENGQKCVEANFIENKLHGLYRRWLVDGTKLEEIIYDNGIVKEILFP